VGILWKSPKDKILWKSTHAQINIGDEITNGWEVLRGKTGWLAGGEKMIRSFPMTEREESNDDKS